MAETIDTILERMLLQIPSRYDTSSGTYTYDIENQRQRSLRMFMILYHLLTPILCVNRYG